MALRTPLVYSAAGKSIASAPVRLEIPSSLTSAALAFGSLLKPGTGGYQAAASGDDTVSHILINLYNVHNQQRNQVYADAPALAAANFYAEAYPLLSQQLELKMGEDGDGGNIADWTATPYVDIVVGAPSLISGDDNPTGGAQATVQIDSSSANSSASGKCFQIIAADPSTDTALVGSKPKNFIVVKI